MLTARPRLLNAFDMDFEPLTESPAIGWRTTGFPEPTPEWRQKWPEFHRLRSTFCELCENLFRCSRLMQHRPSSHQKSDHEVIIHYESLGELRSAASAGCHLCAMAWLSQSSLTPDQSAQGVAERQNRAFSASLRDRTRARLNIHAFWPSKFGNQEPYISLHWKLGSHVEDASYDLRIYETPQATAQIPDGSSEADFIRGFAQEQTSHCMIPRSRSTSSADSSLLASWWLRSCLKHHRHCRQSRAAIQDIPARLLHFGPGESKSFTDAVDRPIQLKRIMNDDVNRVPKYLALSHCWGGRPRLKLTKTNLASCYESIDYFELPRTIQDAIEITRRLGYEHLWVDSLCIIQDSPEDWEDESRKMAGIYGNAQCTIAALGSKSDEEGCFQTRPAFFGRFVTVPGHDGLLQITYPQSRTYGHEYEAAGPGAAPLHQRAWIVQERILSPRTLYYGSAGIFWECREADASDTDPMGLPYSYRKSRLADKRVMERLLRPVTDSVGVQSFHSRWATVVALYTSCALTMLSDRKHAIQGFAQPIAHTLHLTPVACLWKEYIHTELLWSTPRFVYSKRIPRTPTWSWISTSGTARPYYHPWRVSPTEYEVISKPTFKADIHSVRDGSVPSLWIESVIIPVLVFEDILGARWDVNLTGKDQASSATQTTAQEQATGVKSSVLQGFWLPDVEDAVNAKAVHLLPIIENSLHSAGLVITLRGGRKQNQWHRIGSFIHYYGEGESKSRDWFLKLWRAGSHLLELL